MTTKTALGKNVYLLSADDVSMGEIPTFFVIAHGVQQKATFTQAGFDVYFPWGLDNFGWYDADDGFPLSEIYRNYRRGIPQGLTPSISAVAENRPTPSSLADNLSTPLLQHSVYVLPEISLVPDDLDAAFCAKMLATYYREAAMYREEIGIVCLSGKSLFSEVMTFFSLALKKSRNLSDVLVICLFCSVKKGEEDDAMARAAGYVHVKS